MENEILDYQEQWEIKSDYRKNYLTIETLIIIGMFLLVIIGGGSVQPPTPKYQEIILITFIIGLPLLYLFLPIIRTIKKHCSRKMGALYTLQNFCFLLFIFLMTKNIELSFLANTLLFFIVITTFIVCFSVLPQLEINQYNPSRKIKLLVFSISTSTILSIAGFWFFLFFVDLRSERSYYFPFTILGGLVCFILTNLLIFFFFSDFKKYFYLGYYIPRLLLGLGLGVLQFIAFYKII